MTSANNKNLAKAHEMLTAKAPLFVYSESAVVASAFAKSYALAYADRYSRINSLYYTGELKTDIILRTDPADHPDEDDSEIFQRHYDTLRAPGSDGLLIVDGFCVQPKDDPLFREFVRCGVPLLIVTEQPVEKYNMLTIPADEETTGICSDLSKEETDLLCMLLLFPFWETTISNITEWLHLEDTSVLNSLIEKGLADTDGENIYAAPEKAAVLYDELRPSVNSCNELLHTFHRICLTPGLQQHKPADTIRSVISIVRRIRVDNPQEFVLFLQDLFPYLDKYMVVSFLPQLTSKISLLMETCHMDDPCDKTLLLNYKAELFVLKKDFDNALKKMQKAISILETLHTPDASPRVINLLANTYSNQSNLFMQMKRGSDATSSLRTAFDIRLEYARLGKVETRAMMQQLMNLISMLILAQDQDQAEEVLTIYENFVLNNMGEQSIDYGVCLLAQGIYTLTVGNPRVAEMNLLRAETIITTLSGTDNDYARTAFQYLSVLYDRWQRPQLAEEYQNKLRDSLSHSKTS